MATTRPQVQIGLRVPAEMADRLAQMAAAEGRSRAALAYDMVQAALARQERHDINELAQRIDQHDRLITSLIGHCFPDLIQTTLDLAKPGQRTRAHDLVDDVAQAQATMTKMAETLNR